MKKRRMRFIKITSDMIDFWSFIMGIVDVLVGIAILFTLWLEMVHK